MIIFTENISLSESSSCITCHSGYSYAGHKNASCLSCHPDNGVHFSKGDIFTEGAKGCLGCHSIYQNILKSKMHTKIDEKIYIKERYEKYDSGFYNKNCSNCHVKSCSDCHISNKDMLLQKIYLMTIA